jgi:hypothetical protein
MIVKCELSSDIFIDADHYFDLYREYRQIDLQKYKENQYVNNLESKIN